MDSNLHLPHAMPLGETEFAAGSLFRVLKDVLQNSDRASEITAAIERMIDAKIASAFAEGGPKQSTPERMFG